jgi:hypothetical protein
MKRLRLRRPSPALAISLVALFISLAGGAYAATQLPRNSVGSKQLKKNSVTSSKVKNGSLLSKDFKAGQLPAGPPGLQGPKGDTGARGPSDAFTIGDGTSAFSQPPMDLAVPAGDYFVIAKAVVGLGSSSGGTVRCDVAGGSNDDATFGSIESTGHTQETLTATMVTHFSAAGNIHWSCNPPTNGFVGEAVINAVQVGAIH